MNAKNSLNVSRFESAQHRAAILANAETSPCVIVRTLAREFHDLPRRDILTVAGGIGINLGTASRQFQEARTEMAAE